MDGSWKEEVTNKGKKGNLISEFYTFVYIFLLFPLSWSFSASTFLKIKPLKCSSKIKAKKLFLFPSTREKLFNPCGRSRKKGHGRFKEKKNA